jgi:hypothetical protein
VYRERAAPIYSYEKETRGIDLVNPDVRNRRGGPLLFNRLDDLERPHPVEDLQHQLDIVAHQSVRAGPDAEDHTGLVRGGP